MYYDVIYILHSVSIPVERAPMPRLPDWTLKHTVYLYADDTAAKDGKKDGASGFLLGYRFKEKLNPVKSHIYAVTNAHAVENYPAVRVNAAGRDIDPITLPHTSWKTDPKNDLAVAYIGAELAQWDANMVMYPEDILTEKVADDLNIGLGSDVLMATRLIGHEGKDLNLPILRFGTIARMDTVSVFHERLTVDDSKPFMQESIFIECRSVPGHSGSAVIAIEGGISEMRGDDPLEKSEKFKLLGITWCYFPDSNGTNTGIAGVVPAWKLIDLLEREDIVAFRDKNEQRIVKKIRENKDPYDAVPTDNDNDDLT